MSRKQLQSEPAANATSQSSPFHAARSMRGKFRLDVGRSLELHPRLAMGIALLGVVLAATYLIWNWPTYLAEALVYIQPTPAAAARPGEAMRWPYSYDPTTYKSYLQQQILSMTEPDVLQGALGKLPGFRESGESDQDAAERLGRSIEAAREGNSYEVSIKAYAGSAQRAADIANAVATSYVEITAREQRAGDAQRLKMLREEAGRVKKELEDDRAEQAALNARAGSGASATPKPQRASELAGEIAHAQNRYEALDEQLQDLLIEDAAPGTAHIAVAAVAPAHPVPDGVARNAAILLALFLMLSILSAMAAHRMDPRIYAASDVKQNLGFLPIAQLPDFREVSEAVAEEYLLGLTSAIDHGLRQGNLKSCAFTGTGSGTGVTTIATRVRELMERMSRAAVLVDAKGTRAAIGPAAPAPETSISTGVRPPVLIERLAEEARGRDGSVVLADTAPLEVSGETEYLARNADCVIVVMESGVTTRAQLRATASVLERLDAKAVGFVLNRVALAKADRAFRNSVRAVARYAQLQERPTAPEAVRTCREEAKPAPELREPILRAVGKERASATPVAEPMVAAETQRISPLAEPEQLPVAAKAAAAEIKPVETAPTAPRQARIRERAAPTLKAPAEAAAPWWMTPPISQPEEHGEEPGISLPPAAPAAETEVSPRESRLSRLRNLFPGAIGLGTTAARETPPREERPAVTASRAAKTDAASWLTQAPEPEPRIPQGAEAAPASAPAPRFDGAREVVAFPDFLPSQRAHEAQREDQAGGRHDRSETWDDVSILPSRPGQYRKPN